MLRFSKLLLMSFLASMTLSCEKKEVVVANKENKEVGIQNYDKLVKFISVLQGVGTDQVKFDNNKKEFYIPETPFRGSLAEVQAFYEKSNEYKLNYESN